MIKLNINLFLILILLVNSFLLADVKTWNETTVNDFSDNQLNSLIISNNSGGEVQLPPPLVKTADDYNDNSVFRFAARDSAGNIVRTWIQGGNVFVKKYSADGSEITNTIVVNEVAGIAGQDGNSRVDMFNDGTYMVVWADGYGSIDDKQIMYAQIYKNDSVKVGNNFQINETPNGSAQYPVVFANESDQNFWIFYSLFTNNGYKIHVQKRDKQGNKIDSTFLLNKTSFIKDELHPVVAGNSQNFYVCWEGSNTNLSTYVDIYLQKFSNLGVPEGSMIEVNDDIGEHSQFSPDLCVDNENNVFVVWSDSRNEVEPVQSPQTNIYGQIFNSEGNRIGKNLKLNSQNFNGINYYPDIEFLNDHFQLSWTNGGYLIYVNQWKFDPKFSGEMISTIFDASPKGSNFLNIFWDEINNPKSEIKFKIRTGKTISELNNSAWFGPSNSSDYYTSSNTKINTIHNSDRYIQYKAFFTSQNGSTSILKSVGIEYSPFDTIPPAVPKNFTSEASHASITLNWDSNTESDLLEYVIYKGLNSHQYNNTLKIIVPNNLHSFKDDSIKSGIDYFYAIAAVDSSHNESELSTEIVSRAFGTNIYVDDDGNNSGNGTINNPFNTIQKAIDAAFYGDSVRILPGNYSDSFNMKNGVSLIGTNVEECIISTSINASDNCVIKGLKLTKKLICNSVSPVITQNIFLGNNDGSPAITLKYSASPIISKNFITEWSTGIQITTECNPFIKNNIIKTNDVGISSLWDDKPEIINNTIISPNVCAIQLLSFEAVKVESNILIGGFLLNSQTPVSKIYYNDIWKNKQNNSSLPITNLFLDPEFVNEDLQDYHLKPSSPCINSGNPNLEYNDVDGTRNDMGAYGGPDPIQAVSSSQLTRSIYVSSLSGYPDDTISVYVSLDNIAGLAKADFIFDYDNAVINFLNAELTESTNNFSLEEEIISSKIVSFSLSSSIAAQPGNNEILKLNFIVDKDSKTGDATPLALKEVSLFDKDLNKINVRSITNGAFVVNFTGENKNYIFVDINNNGAEDGSRKNPYNTIMEAIQKAVNGDTIFVSAGNYNETIIMKDGISLIGAGASVTKLVTSNNVGGIVFNEITKALLSGFTIKGDENHTSPNSILFSCKASSPTITKNRIEGFSDFDPSIICNDSSNAIFENNYMENVNIYISNSNPNFRNNVIEQNEIGTISLGDKAAPIFSDNLIKQLTPNPAFFVENASPFLKNNLIYCNDAEAVFIRNSLNVKFFNNIIKDIGKSGTGIRLINSTNTEIINNSLITHGKGITEENSESTVMNNIIINNNNFGLLLSPNTVYSYNDVWNNFVNYNNIDPGLNDISTNPLFADTIKDDYRLSESSLCINSGNPAQQYNDLDGSRNDIGAYGGPNADSNSIYLNSTSFAANQLTNLDTIEVAISGSEIYGITEFDFTLSFDPSLLSMVSANSGSLTKAFSVEAANISDGSIKLLLKSTKGVVADSGEVIKLKLATNSIHSTNTFLHFDDASIKDESTYLRKVYNLKNGEIKIVTGISNDNLIPKNFSLSQNYPNPFNPSTKIRYEIPTARNVSIKIYDILGREIYTLLDKKQKPGKYEVEWNASGFASGVYIYRLQSGSFTSTKKLLLLK